MKKMIFVLFGIIVAGYLVGLFLKKEIRTEIYIDATSNSVWSQLIAFEQYAEWSPFVKQISGEATEGAQLNVTIQPPGGDAMNFKQKYSS